MNLKKLLLLLSILLFSLTCDEATLPEDCLGDEGGIAYEDDCGVCDTDSYNDNVTCFDCTGQINGPYVLDECNICNTYSSFGGIKPSYPYGDCDCAGVKNGTSIIDCNNECGGGAVFDECGVCDGDNSECIDCAGIPNGDSIIDCNGECGGEAYTDYCDSCVGGNTGQEECLLDCAGVPEGDSEEDMCGVCDNDPDNDCIQDCYGVWGGTGIPDDCVGICFQTTNTCIGGGNNGGDCTQNGDSDCFVGVCRDSILDPNYNSSCEQDCAGEWAGQNTEDECGICDSNLLNDCVQDCNGDWGGDADEDCAGDCNGIAEIDECGICNDYSGGVQPDYPYGNCACFDETATNFWCNGTDGICNEENMVSQEITGDEYCRDECLDYSDEFENPCGESINNGSSCELNSLFVNVGCVYWGCNDENAVNYDSNATYCEDGTNSCCSYPVSLYFGDITASEIQIFMENPEEVGGFQFSITGATITGASGGSASENGLTASTSSSTVLGFSFGDDSIPTGDGLLTILSVTDISEPICMNNFVISDTGGNNLNISSNSVCSDE